MSFRNVPKGYLPPGFLAVDLAQALELPLHTSTGLPIYLQEGMAPHGSGLILGEDLDHPRVTIAANGGSDELWLAGPDPAALARQIVSLLIAEDYVSAIFVDDALGPIPGALPSSLIGMKGAARTPAPSILVSFRSFSTGCPLATDCAVEVADTDLQQGQGIHGAFQRGDTFNFMAAVGPDFKAGFTDDAPVSNADIAITLAHVLNIPLNPKGALTGRVLDEAMAGGPAAPATMRRTVVSPPAANGFVTRLDISEAAGKTYFDEAGAPGKTFGLRP
jgi:hypothetical protein